MKLSTRKILDRSFSGLGVFSILLMTAALVVILGPLCWRGIGAIFFRGTVEHRLVMHEEFGVGNGEGLAEELKVITAAREPVYAAMHAFEEELSSFSGRKKREYRQHYHEFEEHLTELIGPAPGAEKEVLIRNRYGATRWDRTQVKLQRVLYDEVWELQFDQAGNPMPSRKV